MNMELSQATGPERAFPDESAKEHALAPAIPIEGLKSYQFHRLVTLIENAYPKSTRVGEIGHPRDECVRFRATRSLSFGSEDISDIAWNAARNEFEIRINFFGLYGPASPLPAQFTERIIEDDRTPSPMEDLYDIFNNRLISLLHLIWRKHRYHLRFEPGGTDPISRRFIALCGFPVEQRDRIGAIPRSMILSQIRLLSLHTCSAHAVSSSLSSLLKVPCRIREFVSRRIPLDNAARLQIGRRNVKLGEDTVLGSQIDDEQGKFRLCIGEAPYRVLAPFIPGGKQHKLISDLLAIVNRAPLEWDLEFSFTPGTIPAARLGKCQLGWSSWIASTNPRSFDNTICITPAAGGQNEAHQV
jgi:type VI secretion system protein ImpH